MCTVTAILNNNQLILTSNRDELIHRDTKFPIEYELNSDVLIYPQDQKAGGTWIAASQSNGIRCLLNGAFEPHGKPITTKKSRGLVVLDSFSYIDVDSFSRLYDFDGIEPFTLLWYNPTVIDFIDEIRWDGKKTFIRKIQVSEPLIWQSTTLYDNNTRLKRKQLFQDWIQDHKHKENFDILHFHQLKNFDDLESGIRMSRGDLKTVSITQIRVIDTSIEMKYIDYRQKNISAPTLLELQLIKTAVHV